MKSSFPGNKDLSYDLLGWVFLLCFLAMLSWAMLARDARKQYGAVSFGVFPAFNAADSHGNPFDQHRLHGQLSAVVVTGQSLDEDIVRYLRKLSMGTAMGRKYLNGIILTYQAPGISDQWLQYLTLSGTDYRKINDWKENRFKGNVILVDHNGVIRGVFDLLDKVQRLNFEGAVRGIL